MRRALILLLGLSAAIAAPVATFAMSGVDGWEIGPTVRGRNYSIGMPQRPRSAPAGGVTFDFPTEGNGQIDAMTAPVEPLADARAITLRYRVDLARGARFVADERPNEAATVSLYFQQRDNNWSARGRYGSYRWYAPVRVVLPLEPGLYEVTVRLDEAWTNVNGQPVSQDRSGFDAALRDTARVGLAFGSSSLRSHGVYATGPARFTLLRFEIE